MNPYWVVAAVVVVLVALFVRAVSRDSARERDKDAAMRGGLDPNASDAWRVCLERQGQRSLAETLAPLARTAIRLETAAGESPLGSSRIGGLPDLPADIEWPKNAPFLAQLNLAEIPLPPEYGGRSGHLWFFGDFDEPCFVFARPAGTPLARRDGEAKYTACTLTPRSYTDVPDAFEYEEESAEAFYRMKSFITKETHKLFGHPDWVQEGSLDADSRLLLQLTWDDNAKMPMGDAGAIYFVISAADLDAWRFDDVEVIAQCG